MRTITEKKELDSLRQNGYVLIDFYADWCGPCKRLGEKLPDLEEQFSEITFVKVNIDESPELAKEYKVRSLPTVMISKDTETFTKIVGFDLNKIVEALNDI